MNARYFMPEIGRFVSPDTIVPDPSNPQSYNRYSYGFNNPVKYVDPSGHCGAEAAASGDDSYYVGYSEYSTCVGLRSELEGLLGHTISGIWYLWQMQAMHEGGISLAAQGIPLGPSLTSSEHRAALLALTQYWAQTDVPSLEISGRVVEFGFVLGSTIEDLIAVLSGHEGTGLVGHEPSRAGEYSSGKALANRESGFNDFYGDPDPTNNQVHHTWYWIQMGYYHDYFTAMAGNIWHEIDPRAEQGRSWSDFRAGVWGIAVGSQLQNGQPDLFDLAQDLRIFLGK